MLQAIHAKTPEFGPLPLLLHWLVSLIILDSKGGQQEEDLEESISDSTAGLLVFPVP